jgi:hypothetical protein
LELFRASEVQAPRLARASEALLDSGPQAPKGAPNARHVLSMWH